MTTFLSVNLNAVAFLRNRRDLPWPSMKDLAEIALDAGAAGITVHPRPDERHTRRTDVYDLKAIVARYPQAEFNVEGYPTSDFLELVEDIKPHQVTLVPDDPAQATSDHGWDLTTRGDELEATVGQLKGVGHRVALFIDADDRVPELVASTGAQRVELYTGPYAGCLDPVQRELELDKLVATAEAANALGLEINAGHDLRIDTLRPLVQRIPYLAEVSIGHGLTADCLTYGMAETVRRYLQACEG